MDILSDDIGILEIIQQTQTIVGYNNFKANMLSAYQTYSTHEQK